MSSAYDRAADRLVFIFAVDSDGVITDTNEKFRNLLGYAQSEVCGRKLDDLVIDRMRVKSPLSGFRGELCFSSRSQFSIWLELSSVTEGSQTVFMGFEVTARKRTEQYLIDSQRKLRDAEKKLKDALKLRDEFIGICSHELKTPIASLSLQFQMTARALARGNKEVLGEPQVRKRVESVNYQLSRMTNLIDEMLEVTRVDQAQPEVGFQKLDLSELVKNSVGHFVDQFKNLNIPLELNLSQEPLYVRGDHYRLEQVVSNLLTNAIKYGNGQAVEVSLSSTGSSAQLSVKDHGLGIESHNLSRIFEKFARASKDLTVAGLGLGLYITHKIVESHQGQIVAESTQGVGSKFTVSLPLV